MAVLEVVPLLHVEFLDLVELEILHQQVHLKVQTVALSQAVMVDLVVAVEVPVEQ
jgi:hypothetical protein